MPPTFSKYVRSVKGFAVARFGSGSRGVANELIGARRVDVDRIEWDTSRVTPLTEDYCTKYLRELRGCIKRGELVEATEADYLAYLKSQEPAPAPAQSIAKPITQEPSK